MAESWRANLNKAAHNQKLADFLAQEAPSEFTDWQVVVLFYVALHWVSGWLVRENVAAGAFASHGELRRTTHYAPRTKPNPHCPMSRRAYLAYADLYEWSLEARYDGFLDEVAMLELQQYRISQCQSALSDLREFLCNKHLPI